MSNVNHIDRKELKKQAKEILKSNWKILTSVIVLSFIFFCSLVAIGDFISEAFAGMLILSLSIPMSVMYYKFFLKGVENKKFSFKDLKPNPRSCFAIFKMVLLLTSIYFIFIALFYGAVSLLINTNSFEINTSNITMYLIVYLLIEVFAFIIGIVVSIYFAFTYLYIIDKNINDKIGVFKGIKNSFKLMKGYRLKYIEIALSFLGYWIILIVPNIVFAIATNGLMGSSTLFSGLIIIIIWDLLGILLLSTYFMVCKTLLYKELKKRFEDK